MKQSLYNIIFKEDDYYVLYNCASNNALVLTTSLYDLFDSHTNKVDDLHAIHPSFYKELCDKKFLIQEKLQESDNVIQEIKNKLESPSCLRLTINPTLDCNLRCWYCYEEHLRNTLLSSDKADAIIEFVKTKLSNPKTRHFQLAFFGGEPLIKASVIAIPLAQKLKDICKARNVSFHLQFTTNGFLMSPKITDAIAEIAPDAQFQIAFDGGREIHDQTKFTATHKGTYNRVLGNVNYALAKGLHVCVRCNYTLKNIDSFKELIDDLRELSSYRSQQIRLSFQRVWQEKATPTLHKKVIDAHGYAKTRGIVSTFAGNTYATSYCYADYENSYVINYDGQVYKCTARKFIEKNTIGKLECTGRITHKATYASPSNCRFNTQCKTCKLLPICTICIQNHLEKTTDGCPVAISEEDKVKQIERKMREQYQSYFADGNLKKVSF